MRGVNILIMLFITGSHAWAGVPASITVQGRLTDSLGVPLPAGTKGFLFRIFNAQVGGTEIWSGEDQILPTDGDGLWSAQVGAIVGLTDAVFTDTVRWLDINVNGTQLPRLRLVTGPYAHRVSTVDGASGGTIASNVSIGPGHLNTGSDAFVAGNGNEVSGDYSAVGGGVINGARGEASVVSGGANNWAKGQYSAVSGGIGNSADSAFAFVGGGAENGARAPHATVAGGSLNDATGATSAVLGGTRNLARGTGAVVAGGSRNLAYGQYAFIGAGGGALDSDTNSVLADRSAIVAGRTNSVMPSQGFIGSGSNNTIWPNGHSGSIAAGQSNDVDGLCAVVVGGRSNKAKGDMCFVGGGGQPNALPGDSNVASGTASAIVCGIGNTAIDSCSFVGAGRDNTASGKFATVAGGLLNTAAGDYAFASGRRAKANHSGAFVWGDDTNADFGSTAQGQFLIRASGGVGVGTNAPDAPLHVQEGSAGSVSGNANAAAVLERSDECWLHILSPEANQRGILFGSPANALMGSIRFNPPGTEKGYHFRGGNNIVRLILDSLGNLTADGCVVGSNIACVSDGRFKQDIRTLPNALDAVEKLRGVSYR